MRNFCCFHRWRSEAVFGPGSMSSTIQVPGVSGRTGHLSLKNVERSQAAYFFFFSFSPRFANSQPWQVAATRAGGEAGTLTGANNLEVRVAGVAGTLAATSPLPVASLLTSLSSDQAAFSTPCSHAHALPLKVWSQSFSDFADSGTTSKAAIIVSHSVLSGKLKPKLNSGTKAGLVPQLLSKLS